MNLRLWAVLVCLGMAAAARGGTPVKLLLSVGDDVGDFSDEPLRFASTDAEHVRDLFIELGQVSSDRAVLLANVDVAGLRVKMAELSGRIAELTRRGDDVELLVYVSGHAQGGVMHLRGTHLPLSELRAWAEQTRARLRILIVDACSSGSAARSKGVVAANEYQVRLEQLPLTGTVVMSSSGPAESSQEWDSLGGSLFTHHLISGLRGDADADGNGSVSLSESYVYAYRRTVSEAVNSGQHPAFDLDLVGTGELVLTTPRASASAIIFPANLEGHYLVSSRPRPDVVAEVQKAAGRPLRLAVPAGSYGLRKLEGASVGLLTVDLPYGGEARVDEREMIRRHFAEVVSKGGDLELHPYSLLAYGEAQTAPFLSDWGRWRAGLGVRRTWGETFGTLDVGFGAQGYPAIGVNIHELALAASVSAGHRWLLTPLIPFVGWTLGAEGYQQVFHRPVDLSLENPSGVPALPTARALGGVTGPVAGLELPLPQGLFLELRLAGLLRVLPVASQTLAFGATGRLSVGRVF